MKAVTWPTAVSTSLLSRICEDRSLVRRGGGEADTLAGLIFKIAGRVPARGEIIRHGSGLEFEILESDPRRVKKLKIDVKNVRLPSDEAAEDASG